jgi:tetratricopeptide (TPR) repeat protein
VERLLQQAEQQFAASQLTEPAGENARETYQRILQLDPENPQAKAGPAKIAKEFIRLSTESLQAGKPGLGLEYASAGLELDPEDQALLALRNEAQGILEQQAREKARKVETQRRVTILLEQAEQQLANLQLMAPEGNNAYESYRMVLQLEPQNQPAAAGLARLVAEYQRMSRSSFTLGDYADSLQYAEAGLRIDPAASLLLDLQREAQLKLQEEARRIALEREKQQTINRYLHEARKQLETTRLIAPVGNNAFESLQRVLELDPANSEANQGLQMIADKYVKFSRQSLTRDELDKGLEYALAGLRVKPEDARLLRLKSDAESKLEEQKHRELQQAEQRRHLLRLLREAEQQLAASRLLEPVNDNAYETYQQILQIDPDNQEAMAGIKKIAREFARLSNNHLQGGKLAEALAYASAGLKVVPGDDALLGLHGEAQKKLDQAKLEQRRKELERQKAVTRLLAEARREEADYRRVERKLDAKEQALYQSIQDVLLRKWGYLRTPGAPSR